MKRTSIQRLTLSAMLLALGLVLPFLTGQLPQVGGMLLPLHLPAFLCGLWCGWPWGLAVGFLLPLVRSLLFGMPPMVPTALAMAFELAAYGGVAGAVYGRLPRRLGSVYIALISAMLIGRGIWGLAALGVYALLTENAFTLAAFWAGAFVKAWPGIAVQLAVIPPLALRLPRKENPLPHKGASST